MKQFAIGALLVAVLVLGYLYYEESRNDVTITLPGVELNAN